VYGSLNGLEKRRQLRHCERVLDCGPYLRLATDGVK
jgi:hypothetical protein